MQNSEQGGNGVKEAIVMRHKEDYRALYKTLGGIKQAKQPEAEASSQAPKDPAPTRYKAAGPPETHAGDI